MYVYFPDYPGDVGLLNRVEYKIFVFQEPNLLRNSFYINKCNMCTRFCSKVFEQAAEHPELLDGVGIFSVDVKCL